MTDGSGTTRDGSVQSVDRAISILQVLSRRGTVGVTAIAQDLSLSKSTVARLLGTLQARGLVRHLPGPGHYRLDHGILLLAQGVTAELDVATAGRPVVAELADELNETVNIDIQDGDRAVTVDQATGRSALSAVNWVGRRDPLHVTSPGRLFLADGSDEELQAYLGGGLARFTPHTLTDPDLLRAEVHRVRDQGYAATADEFEVGLAAVAVPIVAANGQVVAALSVSGPTTRLRPEAVPDLAERLGAAAARISMRIGRPRTG